MLASLDLRNLPVVIFGQSSEVTRRVNDWSREGAQVTLVAPTQSAATLEIEQSHPDVAIRYHEPSPADLAGQWLAIVADRNQAWVSVLGTAAAEQRVFFCAIDQPGYNTFSHVGVARAGALELGVSTGGQAPGLAARLTRELAGLFERSNVEAIVQHVVALRATSPPHERSERVKAFVQEIRLDGTIVSPLGAGPPHPAATQKE